MEEEYRIDNNYTLTVIFNENAGKCRTQTCKKTFNFLSQQITTIYSDAIFQGHKFSSDNGGNYEAKWGAGGASATSVVTQNVIRENFSDLPSSKEVEFMHEKLLELGGNPPEIEEMAFTGTKRPVTINKKPPQIS